MAVRAPHSRREITLEEYERLPETRQRCEIVEGEIRTSPARQVGHQRLVLRLARLLAEQVEDRSLGAVLVAPVDVLIRKSPRLTTRQPDLMVVSPERYSAEQLEALARLETGPDIAIEVLSPGETRRDRLSKLSDYAQAGVGEVWIVSRQAETVELLVLEELGYRVQALVGQGSVVRSTRVPELAIPVAAIFGAGAKGE